MLEQKLIKYNVILASKSPRRQELLRGIISDFEIKTKEVEEVYPEGLHTNEVAEFLSDLKAKAFLQNLAPNDLIITADTIVCLGNEILGKPANKQEAEAMLRKLSGNRHQVITGVTLLSTTFKSTFSDITEVEFYALTDKEIAYYVDMFKPYDKAGAYGIQEWMGYIGIKQIIGDYYNVMGLPLHRIYRVLKEKRL